jgi:hypothetical protein
MEAADLKQVPMCDYTITDLSTICCRLTEINSQSIRKASGHKLSTEVIHGLCNISLVAVSARQIMNIHIVEPNIHTVSSLSLVSDTS